MDVVNRLNNGVQNLIDEIKNLISQFEQITFR